MKLRLYIVALFFLCFPPLSYAEAIGIDYGKAIGAAIAIALAVIIGVIFIIVLVVKRTREAKK